MVEFYEVCQIGRESVKSVNASILAALIRQLVSKYEQQKSKSQNYKYYIKCKEKFEIMHKKIGEDEGFESDANEEDSIPADASNEDTQSTSSSCFLVDDHVFRLNRDLFSFAKESDSPNSIVGSSDSANSSGSSDTDEIDIHSLTPSPVGQGKNPDYGKKRLDRVTNLKKEEFPIADVIFCHTDPKYPTIIAWVIKKNHADYDISSRLGKTGVETIPKNENCLEVIITKCKSIDTTRELCSSYQEFSKRIKLDQYKSVFRKKDADQKKSVSLASLLDSKETRVSLSDMKVTTSGLIKASELSILNPKIITSFQTDVKNSVSLNSLIKSEGQRQKVNQESKVPDNEVGEEALKKAQSLLNLSKIRESKSDSNSSGLNDHFNLVQRTDLNGITHLEVSKGTEPKSILGDRFMNKSKIRKEIEGVILTDADSYAKKEPIRQRQSPVLVDKTKVWRSQENIQDPPPIRPERRKFIKKKGLAPSPPIANRFDSQSVHQDKAKNTFYLTQPKTEKEPGQKIVKGQYIRVQSWGNQNNICESNLGSWKGGEPRERLSRKSEDKYIERRRSKSATRTAKRTPMAYRYIDITDDSYYPGNTSRLYGLSQKIREFGGSVVGGANVRRRRNSFDDIIHLDNRSKGNLKSVIKKNKKINDKCCEPKKVTFSAFATVQLIN
ncbi:UNVERIFIED_CONTAM: hypothetical protein PYX00_009474 [Menopon gallinae]|uniref:Uncharacterized protein n=1 Tax=Menopon gallinae TaxID=328185 RepID=A0AAW2HB57_9NEOP